MDSKKSNEVGALPVHKVLECINIVNKIVNQHVNTLFPLDNSVKAQFSNEILYNNRGSLMDDMDKLYNNLLNKSKSKRDRNDNDVELYLNYINCLKEYYKCYISHFNDLYEMCRRKDPKKALTLANLYNYLRKLILLHIKCSLNLIPYKLNHGPLFFNINNQLFNNSHPLNRGIDRDNEFVYSKFIEFLQRDLPEFSSDLNNVNFEKIATILDTGSGP